jgi:hypothetical protein
MAQNRCPLCGSETGSAAADDPRAIREQIRRLEQRLQQIEGGEGAGQHPHIMTGGYGADPEEDA